MAPKKTSRKKKRLVSSDPPVMVGGGGSSFIWIAKDLDPQMFQPSQVPSNAPKPPNPDDYYCFRIQGSIGKLVIDEGLGGGPNNKGVNDKKYFVKFAN
jgi:hypothetical protein